MPIDFRRLRFDFPPTTGRPQSATLAAVFPTAVSRAEAAINGFDIGYTNGDHHLLRTQIDTFVSVFSGSGTVNVTVNFSLRDNSGNFDDPYSGFVEVVVIADRV